MMLFLLFVFILFSDYSHSLESCETGVTCPTGGIWSEWTTIDDAQCATTCGSCSSILQTRYCLSTPANCTCTGLTYREYPCNTQKCVYPAQRTCCLPYIAMKINGSLQCGPLPSSNVENMACCPIGGLWTSWSAYGRNSNNTMWIRTRECVSESAGCACTGESTQSQTDCPCITPVQNTDCTNDYAIAANFTELVIDDDTCYATVSIHTININDTKYCYQREVVTGTVYSPVIRMRNTDGDCLITEARSNYKCNETETIDQPFTCDLETLYWVHEQTRAQVVSYSQYKFIK